LPVGTPSRRGDGHADLSYVFKAAEEIAQSLDGYTVIITKSTVPVGTGKLVEKTIRAIRPDADFDVASNPEFLREGSAIEDFRRPDRVVCGTTSDRAIAVLRELYRPLFLNETPMLFTARETSELIKYAANAFLATKITFINEMADYLRGVGANVQDVAPRIGLDGRIGAKFPARRSRVMAVRAFPRTPWRCSRRRKTSARPRAFVEAVASVNEARKSRMTEKIEKLSATFRKEKRSRLLGLTFKPNTGRHARRTESRPFCRSLCKRVRKSAPTIPKA
jgi:UDPglucose 6-dehydrogenase